MAKQALESVRQGDLLLVRHDQAPENLRPIPPEGGHLVLAHGEVTGHSHAVPALPTATLFRPDDMPSGSGVMWLKLGEAAELVHPEHDSIVLDAGSWERRPQCEWSDDHEPRQVAD